ncbi:MAG: alanine--tRNA ligase-related protein [Oscillospiraceae bacterium]|nr:alanine--tRNA ligase-related protein [Oscillospiraceae bacterium]
METKELYYDNPFLRRFAAVVISCEEAKGGWAVTLDQTAFYPEGGGQPYDTGTLGGAQVREVREKDGVIVHLCDAPLAAGAAVEGAIDWARRFDHMQQHSGEHICSGLICARFHCDNVGFHMGADAVTIDFNADIAWEALLEIEAEANRYIYEDHPIDIRLCRGAALDAIDYRSKKPLAGDVRIVSFPGADCCACCGTHVASSGQVGLVKFLSVQKFRAGVRIELLCGGRALRYLSACWEQDVRVAQALSVKPAASFAAVERLLGELSALKLRCARLEEAAFAQIAAQYEGKGDVLLFEDEMNGDSVRRLCDAVANACGGRCAVFAGAGNTWKYAISQADGDLRALTKALNAALCGRGGGKPNFVQGSVNAARAAIEEFFNI